MLMGPRARSVVVAESSPPMPPAELTETVAEPLMNWATSKVPAPEPLNPALLS